MPKPAPQHISSKMPNGWKLWWIDGTIIHDQGLQHDTGQPGHMWPGRLTRIGEVDPSTGATYDATISYWLTKTDLAKGDRVSLVGHVRSDAKQIGAPSFIISHDSGAYCPVGLGLPDSWVVCGGSDGRGGIGGIFKALKAGSGSGNLTASIWQHLENLKGKPGYIYPLYIEFLEWIMSDPSRRGPNARTEQQSAGELDF